MPQFPTIRHRLIEFRNHYSIPEELVADILNIPLEVYKGYEDGTLVPTVEILSRLADLYKVTLKELYGDIPMINILHSNDVVETPLVSADDLKFSDLSADEKELILRYRLRPDKDELIYKIIKETKLS